MLESVKLLIKKQLKKWIGMICLSEIDGNNL